MRDTVDIRLVREPLVTEDVVARVSCVEAGGIAVFLGTTRAESGEAAGKLIALDYHAYEEMALGEIRKLVAVAGARWEMCGVAVWHRLGEVKVGEASVVIAVSCAHRGEAFDACEFLIDELKRLAPIWKREVYESASRWQ